MINIKRDLKFGLGHKDKRLDASTINECYYFRIAWDDNLVEQVLSFSDSKALSLMLIKAKERIYGW